MKRKYWLWIVVVLLALGTISNILEGDPKSAPQTSAPIPTATSQRAAAPLPTTASSPTPRGQLFSSDGLGLARTDWEAKVGKPERSSAGFFDYAGGKYSASFQDGRVSYIEYHWGDKAPVSLDIARSQITPLLPADAVLVKSYTSRDRPVDLYSSTSLATIYRTDSKLLWVGGEPGNFIILYRLDQSGRVFTALIALGNNP